MQALETVGFVPMLVTPFQTLSSFNRYDDNCGEQLALLLAGSLYGADVVRNGCFQLVQTGEFLFFPQKVQQFDSAELPVSIPLKA